MLLGTQVLHVCEVFDDCAQETPLDAPARERHRRHGRARRGHIRRRRGGQVLDVASQWLSDCDHELGVDELELVVVINGHPGHDAPIVMGAVAPPAAEAAEHFDCFGGRCGVLVLGRGPAGTAQQAAVRARRRLLQWHQQFSRFDPESELSALNRDPRERVPVSAMMARFAHAAVQAAQTTGGLVDPTLVGELEQAGYADDFASPALDLRTALSLAPPRRPARPDPAARWRDVDVDMRANLVSRPVGLRLDSGGVAKGLFGDVLATVLGGHESFAVAAAGDVRFGGTAGIRRPVHVASPLSDAEVLHTFMLDRGAVATSGMSRRSWLDRQGRVAHHLLDPGTGAPAFTGILQVTALAPSGVEAEARAKAALLSGPPGAVDWLPHGGVVVYEDGRAEVIEA